jgi:HD superfamily phosphohydrolase
MYDTMYHVIKDPVHDTMQLTTLEDSWVKPFIDSPNFQRLRHIKQLGMGDLIFPGAVHTRFNHCLGCCYVASQIAHKIGLAEEERQLVIIACLLHDIGHGPFSHTFEELFDNKLIKHEDWTPFFLADYRTDSFFNQYNRRNPRHHLSDEKFQLIEDMIMHRLTTKKVLADIVSSQLDADRLDYLLRDSHFCGVSYGEFDLRWMLHCMAIVDSGQGERLGITHKGIGVVEHYLVARRLMTRNIYHYQKKLAMENLLVQLLRNLAENLNHSLYADIKSTRLGKFLAAANEFNQQANLSLKNSFLEKNYAIYKELSDYDIFALIRLLANNQENLPAIQIAQRLQNRVMPKIIRLDHLDFKQVQTLLLDFKNTHKDKYDDWQLTLIQTPHQSYKVDNDPILVLTEHDHVKPINEVSLMIKGISDKHEQATFICIDKVIFSDEPIQQLIKNLVS